MFNENEWSKIFKGLGYALCVGIGIDVVLFFWALFAESFNCFCDMFGDERDSLPEVQESTFIYVIIIALVIGLLIGIFSALSNRDDRRSKEKSEERVDSRNNILRMANSVLQRAEATKKSINSQVDEICYYKENKEKDMDIIYKQIENEEKILLEDLEKYKVNQ